MVAIGAIATWLVTGAHRGWTKTEVEKITLDEITGIEGRIPERQFVAGVDFLGAGLVAAGALASLSFFFRQQPTTKNQKPNTEH